ncbi:MAG: hypothetical protein M1837_006715 [Sclerophora amabilis]|nr:MAG: hypothetical protein M1837_006715 [Sclerophora amabilis]
MSSSAASLAGCVSSLKSSMSMLDSSISILDSGVNDFPRLKKVLHTTRHFEITSESALTSAQDEVRAEIEPEVQNLLARVAAYMARLERREGALIAKSDLQEGRIGQKGMNRKMSVGDGAGRGSSAAKLSLGGRGGKEERLKMLRQKKERLSYAVDRLTLQAGQRERQLRMSMAAQ